MKQIYEAIENSHQLVSSPTGLGSISQIQVHTNEKPITFSDAPSDKPMRFLKDVKHHIEYIQPENRANLINALNKCIIGESKNWWYLVQDRVETFDDFEKFFKEEYWNDVVQHSLQWKVTNGSYFVNGSLTRVQYMTQIFNIAYDLGMNEQVVCSYLPNHFERHIKPHLFNKTTEKEIKQILANFDADDKKNKPRNNNTNNNNNNTSR